MTKTLTLSDMKSMVRKLRDTDLACIDYTEDTRRKQVFDSLGTEVGFIDALFIDDAERKVRFFRINPDWPFETDARKFLVPVDAITSIRNGEIRLDRPVDDLAAAPRDDSKLNHPQSIEFLYEHYGFSPFWTADYVYPPYPYYV